MSGVFFFFQAEDGIRYLVRSRGLGDVYKRQDDEDPRVKMRAIVALLSADPSNSCRSQLRSLSMLGNVDERVMALNALAEVCLLYTSDAADERSSVDLGGRRIIKKKNNVKT